jgi:hypothetical protein
MDEEKVGKVLVATRMGRVPTVAESVASPEGAQYLLMTEALRALAEGMDCLGHALKASIGECGLDLVRLASLFRRSAALEQAVGERNWRDGTGAAAANGAAAGVAGRARN